VACLRGAVSGELRSVGPVHLERIGDKEEKEQWRAYVERYHPLGAKRPFGLSLRYFVTSRYGRVGCLQVASGARALRCRDEWIGWSAAQRLSNLPLLTEFLNFAEGDTESDKQDCELKAFHRLTSRLKVAFPRLPIMLLLDGLYPNGPVLRACRQSHWQFMIVLKDESLPSVWEEYHGLCPL
jgi:hypothetical protein